LGRRGHRFLNSHFLRGKKKKSFNSEQKDPTQRRPKEKWEDLCLLEGGKGGWGGVTASEKWKRGKELPAVLLALRKKKKERHFFRTPQRRSDKGKGT